MQPTWRVVLCLALYVVVSGQAILEVGGVDRRDGAFFVGRVAVLDVSRQTEGEVLEGVGEGEAVLNVVVIDVGETIDDLQKFDPDEFVNALFDVKNKEDNDEDADAR